MIATSTRFVLQSKSGLCRHLQHSRVCVALVARPASRSTRFSHHPFQRQRGITTDPKLSPIFQGAGMGKVAISSSAYVQVLGLGLDVGDSTPSVLLFFDHHRYLFNAGEGFQRFCVQHKMKLNKMVDILATRASLDAMGGIPGMVLTMSDANNFHNVTSGLGTVSNCKANIYGPKGIQHLADAMGSYIRMGGVNFHAVPATTQSVAPDTQTAKETKSQPVIKSNAVTISAVVLEPALDASDAAKSGQISDGAPEWLPNKRQRTDNQGVSAAEDGQHQPWAACYICQLTAVPGKFLPQKAKALGVTPGPLFGQLKAGNAVQGKDRMIEPHEVMEDAPASPTVIVADCPTALHLPSLLASTAWVPFARQTGSNPPQHANCVVHLAPADVVQLLEYQSWMSSFGDTTQHIMVNSQAVPNSFPLTSSATLQAKLNCISSKTFPIPHGSSSSSSLAGLVSHEGASKQAALTSDGTAVSGTNLLKFHLRPVSRVNQVETVAELAFSVPDIQKQLEQEMPEVLEAARRSESDATCSCQDIPDVIQQAGPEELEVVFLGTGAALPSKYRNVTCIYINRFQKGGMLLDCGEGSLGQLTRRFGVAGVRDIVCSLACVWISHIHADHHAGLPRLLAARAEWMGPGCTPVPVFGPWPLEKVLRHTAALQSMLHTFFNQTNLVAKPQQQVSPECQSALSAVKAQLGLKTLQSVLVVHCAHAYAAVLEGETGWKVVFSGDTRPCDQLVQAAQNATLLIHEATFEDELIEDAKAKKHSLTCEAVEVGAKAGAYRTVLTHFSQRYPKIPKIEKSFQSSTCIAFDLMSINLQDLSQLPTHVPAVTLLCKDADEEIEEVE